MISKTWTSWEQSHEYQTKMRGEWLRCCGRWCQRQQRDREGKDMILFVNLLQWLTGCSCDLLSVVFSRCELVVMVTSQPGHLIVQLVSLWGEFWHHLLHLSTLLTQQLFTLMTHLSHQLLLHHVTAVWLGDAANCYMRRTQCGLCVCLYWLHGCAVQKRLNQSKCRLESDSCGSKEPRIRRRSRSDKSICSHEGWEVGNAAFCQMTVDSCYYITGVVVTVTIITT